MSIVRVDTNIPTSNINEEFLLQTTESLAKTLQKPKSVSILIFFHKIIFRIFYIV